LTTWFFCSSLLKTFIMLNGSKSSGAQLADLLQSVATFLSMLSSVVTTSSVQAVFCEDRISGLPFTEKFDSDGSWITDDVEMFCSFGETGWWADSAEEMTDSGVWPLDTWPTDGTAKQSGVCGCTQGLDAIEWSLMQLRGLYGTTDSTINKMHTHRMTQIQSTRIKSQWRLYCKLTSQKLTSISQINQWCSKWPTTEKNSKFCIRLCT